jgi:hypothetical protein
MFRKLISQCLISVLTAHAQYAPKPVPSRRAQAAPAAGSSRAKEFQSMVPPYTYKIIAAVGQELSGAKIESLRSYAMTGKGDIFVLADVAPKQLALFRNGISIPLPLPQGLIGEALQVDKAGDWLFLARSRMNPPIGAPDTAMIIFNGKILAKAGQTFNGAELVRIYKALLAADGTVVFVAEYSTPASKAAHRSQYGTYGLFDTKGNAFTYGSVIEDCAIENVYENSISIAADGTALFKATARCSGNPIPTAPSTTSFLSSPKRLHLDSGSADILPDGRVVHRTTIDGKEVPRMAQELPQFQMLGRYGEHVAYTTKRDGVVDEAFNPILPVDFTFGSIPTHDDDGKPIQLPEMTVHLVPAHTSPTPPPDIRKTSSGPIFFAEGVRYYRQNRQDAMDDHFTGIFNRTGPILYSGQQISSLGMFRVFDSFAVDDSGRVLAVLSYYGGLSSLGLAPNSNVLILATPAGDHHPCDDPRIPNSYDQSSGQHHFYVITSQKICAKRESAVCTLDKVFVIMLQTPAAVAPVGASDAPQRVKQCGTLSLQTFPANIAGYNNEITTAIDMEEHSVTNYTMKDHIFYPGKVTRQIIDVNDEIFVKTTGEGTGEARWLVPLRTSLEGS